MKILLADDMDIVREGIAIELKKVIPDAEIDEFNDGKYAWEAVQKKIYDLVLTDISMRDMHGPELAERIHNFAPEIPILFVTAEAESRIREMGIQEERCIFKPVSEESIRAKLDELDSLAPFQIRKPVRETVQQLQQTVQQPHQEKLQPARKKRWFTRKKTCGDTAY